MLVTVVVNPDVVLKVIVPEVELKFTTAAEEVTRLLFTSWICTVTAPEATPAVTDCTVLVITTFVAVPVPIVSVCVAEVSPVDAAVIVGVPAVVSLK